MLASEVIEILGNTFLVQHQSTWGSVLRYTHVGLCVFLLLVVLGQHLAGVSITMLSVRSWFLMAVIAPAGPAAPTLPQLAWGGSTLLSSALRAVWHH